MSHRPIPTPGAAPNTTSTRAAVDDWRARAACRDEDGDLFFAAEGEREPYRSLRIAAAQAVCRACPVAAACLADALQHNDAWAVRGGLDLSTVSPRGRYRLRRSQDAA